jgi:hypothetical protein
MKRHIVQWGGEVKVSELIAKLQNVVERDGDVNVYTSDMEAPRLVLSQPQGNDEEEDANCNRAYLCIE